MLLLQDEYVAVVDDSPEIVVLISSYLKSQGFNVLTAQNSAELYTLLAANKIALILLDIGLPDKNGNEILPDLLQSHPDLSVIMVTGTTDLEVALDCLRQGADDYLTKPVSIQLFHHTIQNSLKKRRLAINNRLYQEKLETITEELEKNKNLLVKAERSFAIGQMAAQLVHAIRNPLTSIGGTSRLLARKTSDPNLLKFLNIITKETIKIETTLEDLFNVMEEKQLALKSCALFPLIRKSLIPFYTEMKERKIEHVLNLKGDGPDLYIDEQRMRQAFLHLIRNSIEAMVDGGVLTVDVREESDRVHIEFIDSTISMIPDTLEHAKDHLVTTKTYGNGLGLNLVERIVTGHGGHFTLQTAENGGTEAVISLPVDGFTRPSIVTLKRKNSPQ